MKFLNLWDKWDFHIHSINYSDWFNTIDELIIQAGKIRLKKIAITDHSQIVLDEKWISQKSFREDKTNKNKRWKNIHNNIEVLFWVEGDILDEKWNICSNIQWIEWEFLILSLHKGIYKWDIKNVTNAYLSAIEKNKWKIDCIWHPCLKKTSEYLDIEKLVKICNKEDIPIEFNCVALMQEKTNIEKLNFLLTNANKIYINSDAHTLYELTEARKIGIKYLKENWFI